jgi:hypothetical protein
MEIVQDSVATAKRKFKGGLVSRPYTKARIGNMLPATFFSNDRQHY